MAKSNGRPKLSEKGLLTPDNCVVTLIDLHFVGTELEFRF